MQSSILLLQAGGNNSMANMILILGIFIVFYFFLLRPQSKKAKEQANFMETLEKGESVVTIGGIHGKITKVGDSTFTILVDTKTYLTIEKSTVSMEYTMSARETDSNS